MMIDITPKKFSISQEERKHLLKAWIAVSIAFGIAMSPRLALTANLLVSIALSGVTIGVAFLLHELAHKYIAVKYRCHAEFRANNNMLFLMLFMSFFGFIFAAPGGVQISGHISRKQYGHISLAGPVTNIILAVLVLPLLLFNPAGVLGMILRYAFFINAWLALFNMIPFARK
jgi:Zn-dependent protease